MALHHNLNALELCNGFQLIIQAQFSAPNKSSVAFINGSLDTVLRSISGNDLANYIRSADINLVGYNFIGESSLSISVNPNNLFI